VPAPGHNRLGGLESRPLKTYYRAVSPARCSASFTVAGKGLVACQLAAGHAGPHAPAPSAVGLELMRLALEEERAAELAAAEPCSADEDDAGRRSAD